VNWASVLIATAVLASGCTSERVTEVQDDPDHTTESRTTASTVMASDRVARTTCWEADPSKGSDQISFSDATAASGLIDPLVGMFAHAAAWGDVDGDMSPDLVVGTFADRSTDRYEYRGATEPSPDRLLLRRDNGYVALGGFPEVYGRTSGAAFADLDNDGDLDLVLSRNVKEDQGLASTEVYENVAGSFVVAESGIDMNMGGRSVGVLDYDNDGLLDLFIAEDHYRGGHSRLYRNTGQLHFVDATTAAGFPDMLAGLGVATADVDGDHDIDLFIAGDNRLFLNVGDRFEEVTVDTFQWPPVGDEDDPAGAAFGDVDRDGRMDLIIGQHFNSTVDHGVPAPVRLFLNRTEPRGDVVFEEVTEAAGLTALPTKAPHVEIADLDNDGWPDIVTSASSSGGTRPAVFRGLGTHNGVPRFETPEGLGDAQYWVTAPLADADLDGRLDVLLVEFEPEMPSILLRNESASGNWLEVSLGVKGRGIGAHVFVYAPGESSSARGRLLGTAGITASRGYSAGVPAVAHFGLGDVDTVDVVVHLPGGTELSIDRVPVNRHIRLPDGC
jgi:hypothetical protein